MVRVIVAIAILLWKTAEGLAGGQMVEEIDLRCELSSRGTEVTLAASALENDDEAQFFNCEASGSCDVQNLSPNPVVVHVCLYPGLPTCSRQSGNFLLCQPAIPSGAVARVLTETASDIAMFQVQYASQNAVHVDQVSLVNCLESAPTEYVRPDGRWANNSHSIIIPRQSGGAYCDENSDCRHDYICDDSFGGAPTLQCRRAYPSDEGCGPQMEGSVECICGRFLLPEGKRGLFTTSFIATCAILTSVALLFIVRRDRRQAQDQPHFEALNFVR